MKMSSRSGSGQIIVIQKEPQLPFPFILSSSEVGLYRRENQGFGSFYVTVCKGASPPL